MTVIRSWSRQEQWCSKSLWPNRHILRTTWSRKDGVWSKVEDRVDWKAMDDPSGLIPNVGERLVTIFHKPEVPLPAEASSSHLHPESRVTEMKRRLKELHAPVWGKTSRKRS